MYWLVVLAAGKFSIKFLTSEGDLLAVSQHGRKHHMAEGQRESKGDERHNSSLHSYSFPW